jgi:membrane protein implicated in regulation of membrane protease activity
VAGKEDLTMDWKRLALLFVLADFSVLTAYATIEHGVAGIIELALANSVTITLSVDLLIALSLVAGWMWSDARQRGVTPFPYLLLTATLGSIGPLLYLVRRPSDRLPARA